MVEPLDKNRDLPTATTTAVRSLAATELHSENRKKDVYVLMRIRHLKSKSTDTVGIRT